MSLYYLLFTLTARGTYQTNYSTNLIQSISKKRFRNERFIYIYIYIHIKKVKDLFFEDIYIQLITLFTSNGKQA
jgi:hypothetical protein